MSTVNKPETIAWDFLRKNPKYRDECKKISISQEHNNKSCFHSFFEQSHVDKEAEKWGLFTYKSSKQVYEPNSPFWHISPMLEAETIPNSKSALIPMLQKAEAYISGLSLLDGDLILKAEQGDNVAQIRIKNGASFNETSGLILKLPLDLSLPIRISRIIDFWEIATSDPLKKIKIR